MPELVEKLSMPLVLMSASFGFLLLLIGMIVRSARAEALRQRRRPA